MFIKNGIAYADNRTPIIKVIEATPIASEYKLKITFNNGEIKIFDFEPLLKYQAFEPLKDKKLFKQVYVSQGTVNWANGEIDYSPYALYVDSVPLQN